MKHLSVLVAALLLYAAQPLLTCASLSTTLILLAQEPARAQSSEEVAKVAQAITVRIEGSTQGSGVLVKRAGNRYTVLTAWHVLSGERQGEELDIYTPDGQRHQLEQGSVKRLGNVDMAVLSFSSSNAYILARLGDVKSVLMGSPIYVSGFPLPSGAVPSRLLRFLKGDVIANASIFIPNGYQLLYSNTTLPGMSGGAVLSANAQLVGIHGQGETDIQMSEQKGVAVKTGTNQAIPISYYLSHYPSGQTTTTASPVLPRLSDVVVANQAWIPVPNDYNTRLISPVGLKNSEDALALAANLLANNDYDAAIKQSSAILSYRQSWFALYIRASARLAKGYQVEALADVNDSLAFRGDYAASYDLRARIKVIGGGAKSACQDLVLAKSYGSQSGESLMQKNCAESRYPANFFSSKANLAFFSKAKSSFVKIGTASSYDNSLTPVFVRVISVAHPVIIVHERSRMNAIWNDVQTTRVEINCAQFWLQPSAVLYQETAGWKNITSYLHRYFCIQPG